MQRVSGWHNISTNKSLIEVNKITFDDILIIINSIKNKYRVSDIESLIQLMYDHIVNYNNPHSVEIEQLPEQVIDVFYETWLSEGYYGTKEDFINIIYYYTIQSNFDNLPVDGDIIDWTNLIKHLESKEDLTQDELEKIEHLKNIVPTVKDFYTRLLKHNTDIIDIHTPILDSIFKNKPNYVYPPLLSYTQVGGIPYSINKLYDKETNSYVDVPVSSLAFPNKATIVLHGKYKTGQWFYLRNNDTSTKFFSVRVDSISNNVYFTSSSVDGNSVELTVSTSQLLNDIFNNANKITIVILLDGNKLTGLVQLYGNYMEIPVNSELEEVDGTIYRYPIEARHTYNTLMTIPRMERNDYLEEIAIYPTVLSDTELSFIFNIYN